MFPTQIELYREAQKLEEKSRDFYLEKTAELKEQKHAKLFKQLAEEERRVCRSGEDTFFRGPVCG